MLLILFRIVFSPLFWIGGLGIRLLNKLSLRDAGVLEVVLDSGKAQRHPLWFRTLESAAAEERIRVVHLKIESVSLGWAELQSLRDCIQRISKSGTPVVASMESGDTPSLFLASACDEAVLAPLEKIEREQQMLRMRIEQAEAKALVGFRFRRGNPRSGCPRRRSRQSCPPFGRRCSPSSRTSGTERQHPRRPSPP